MHTVHYHLQASNLWLRHLHEHIPSTFDQNQLRLAHDIGQGTVQVIEIQEGLFVTFIDVKLKQPLLLKRVGRSSNDHFILNFHLSKSAIPRQIEGEEHLLGIHHRSMLLSSAMTSSDLLIPANIPIKIFNITFSQQWLIHYVVQESPVLQELKSKNQPMYIFENLDYTYQSILANITPEQASLNRLTLFSNVLQLLSKFFQHLSSREVDTHSDINPTDFQYLMQVRKTIETHWQQTPSNEQLAEQAHMSLSKFKRLFKKVFGTSPYQYHLGFKMEKAMELLRTKQHTVSDVGYAIGYSNLSQFSKAFFKHHQVLPRQVS